jgi:uncharacterized membrane protein YfcA
VTSSLVAKGHAPKYAIGSVNTAEFFVTVATSITFFITMKTLYWQMVLALIVGGTIAAPIGALMCKKIRTRPLMVAVGLLIIGLSFRSIWALNSTQMLSLQPALQATKPSSWK